MRCLERQMHSEPEVQLFHLLLQEDAQVLSETGPIQSPNVIELDATGFNQTACTGRQQHIEGKLFSDVGRDRRDNQI